MNEMSLWLLSYTSNINNVCIENIKLNLKKILLVLTDVFLLICIKLPAFFKKYLLIASHVVCVLRV